ncbi:SMC-Scp complex subunit ScpB [Halalkalibacterium ligniniphilum]|uniref:SMC-Scp complex subunit ScpB n=1 Tax=Halalkalibacterium ligniniphilum TaxID=1134413 RepID=UPI00034CEB8D|nr:SMC-Scp complex subunit ScpB [Halalkalibacterium ligniniphilum]
MTLQELKAAIEGILFISGDEGVTIEQLSDLLELDKHVVQEALDELRNSYQNEARGLQIVEVAHAYRLSTKPEHAPYFKKLAAAPQQGGLSQAALEALAIIAYRQPITRVEVEDVRGVKSEKAIQTLISKLLVKEVGRAPGTGRPILYGTTSQFLDHFGLKSLEELPPLPEAVDEKSLEDEADLFFQQVKEEWSNPENE